MHMMAPLQWLARTLPLMTALGPAVTALRFTEDEWDLKPGQPLNISWHDTTQDVNIGIYLARKVPGRAELQLNLNRKYFPTLGPLP